MTLDANSVSDVVPSQSCPNQIIHSQNNALELDGEGESIDNHKKDMELKFIEDFESYLENLHASMDNLKATVRMDPILIAKHCNLVTDFESGVNSSQTLDSVYAESFFSSENDFLSITKIYLNEMRISEIRCLDLFTNLTHLYLHGNRITQLPLDQFEFLNDLSFLVLSENRIKNVENIKHLNKLYFLDLSSNRIEDLDVRELPQSLRILNINDNPCDCDALQEELIQNLPNLMSLNDEPITIEKRKDIGLDISSTYEEEFRDICESLFPNLFEKLYSESTISTNNTSMQQYNKEFSEWPLRIEQSSALLKPTFEDDGIVHVFDSIENAKRYSNSIMQIMKPSSRMESTSTIKSTNPPSQNIHILNGKNARSFTEIAHAPPKIIDPKGIIRIIQPSIDEKSANQDPIRFSPRDILVPTIKEKNHCTSSLKNNNIQIVQKPMEDCEKKSISSNETTQDIPITNIIQPNKERLSRQTSSSSINSTSSKTSSKSQKSSSSHSSLNEFQSNLIFTALPVETMSNYLTRLEEVIHEFETIEKKDRAVVKDVLDTFDQERSTISQTHQCKLASLKENIQSSLHQSIQSRIAARQNNLAAMRREYLEKKVVKPVGGSKGSIRQVPLLEIASKENEESLA